MNDKWWLKPVLISVLNYAVVLPLITFAIGWSAPVIVILAVGFVMGCWWIYDQRPKR